MKAQAFGAVQVRPPSLEKLAATWSKEAGSPKGNHWKRAMIWPFVRFARLTTPAWATKGAGVPKASGLAPTESFRSRVQGPWALTTLTSTAGLATDPAALLTTTSRLPPSWRLAGVKA